MPKSTPKLWLLVAPTASQWAERFATREDAMKRAEELVDGGWSEVIVMREVARCKRARLPKLWVGGTK